MPEHASAVLGQTSWEVDPPRPGVRVLTDMPAVGVKGCALRYWNPAVLGQPPSRVRLAALEPGRPGSTPVDGEERVVVGIRSSRPRRVAVRVPRGSLGRRGRLRSVGHRRWRRTAARTCTWVCQARHVGLLPPLLQRFGISPHLDGVDPFGIHGVGRDGDVQAPVEFASARDEVTEGSDPGVALSSSSPRRWLSRARQVSVRRRRSPCRATGGPARCRWSPTGPTDQQPRAPPRRRVSCCSRALRQSCRPAPA